MKLMLVGPDDSGFWFLENENGLSWKIVERWADHSAAAALFGWDAPDDATDEEQNESAREFLMEHIGAEIEAPRHIAIHFEELEREAVEEVVSEFIGVRLRSTIEAVDVEDRRIGFKIEGPEIEFDEDHDKR
jgi:hypothetical protein